MKKFTKLVFQIIILTFQLINRTLAAIITSTTALAVLALVGERPTMLEIISWMDAETLLLLFSMMLLVTLIAETGFFDYLARKAFEVFCLYYSKCALCKLVCIILIRFPLT